MTGSMSAASSLEFLPPRSGAVDVLIVAGEHSGDEHAARMVRELLAKQPTLAVAALGGPALAAAGAQLLHDMTASSVVGLVEVIKNYSFFKELFEKTLRWIATHGRVHVKPPLVDRLTQTPLVSSVRLKLICA